MFFTLLAITLSLSIAVPYTAARVFRKPIGVIFTRIIQDEIGANDFVSQQQLMARPTGSYKRGNERSTKNHPRNRGR
jgi:hypothetical protein